MANDKTTYDYIICGGGTAGCLLASRLAEADHSILILEAGGPRASFPASDIPFACSQLFDTDADWKIVSEPCQNLNSRRLKLRRGKMVGGSSSAPADFDAWGGGWSGEEMHRYMSKAETFKNKPWFSADESAHGHSGALVTAPHDNAPISELVLESYQDQGLPLDPDMFSTGRTAHGCGHAIRTINQGVRASAASFLKGHGIDSIKMETGVLVDTVEIENHKGHLKAVGVNAVSTSAGDQDRVQFKASKEVILSSGAYCTPTVLMRSGIGPAGELAKHGITSKLELPGVGRNLQDHMMMANFYEISKPDLTNDHLLWPEGAQGRSIAQYQADRTGIMSQIPFGPFAYARLDERLADPPIRQEAKAKAGKGLDPVGLRPEQPHAEFWSTECYFPQELPGDIPGDRQSAFAMVALGFGMQSRGEVTLTSSDPTASPKVQHNYLDDPLDMLILSEACRQANELAVKGRGTKDIITGAWPVNQSHHKFTTREEWEPEIRKRAESCWHPAGTAKMGDDLDAVVDYQLRVHGVESLRVVDASIMPKLPGGHPQMAVYGIAEKAADMIRAST